MSFSDQENLKKALNMGSFHAGRNYEQLHLPSGLQCVLINDASSHTISAAMAIGTGSYSDSNVLGVAHLCEHIICSSQDMVRLQNILMRCGGSFSACTGTDQTTFGFEMSTYAHESAGSGFLLDEVLPVFAGIFKAPRIHASVVAREIGFVDDEHCMNKDDLEKVLWQGLRLLASEKHRFCRFSTGNRTTLGSAQGLKRMLMAHHSRAFLPQNSAFVIKGPQSINHLRKSAFRAFSHLASPELNIEKQEEDADIFRENTNCIFIKSSARKIRLYFPLKKTPQKFSKMSTLRVPSTVSRVLASILGNESPNSLCHYLRNTKQYIERLLAYTQAVSQGESLFVLALEATESGMRRLHYMVAIVFHYIEEVLAKMSECKWKAVAQEYLEIDDYHFACASSEDEEVVSFAENLQMGVDMMRGDWNPAALGQHSLAFYLSEFFSRKQLRLQIADCNSKLLAQFGQTEALLRDEFFGFEYVCFKADFSQIASDLGVNLAVSVPIGSLRQAIPRLLQPPVYAVNVKHRDIRHSPPEPKLVSHSTSHEVWSVAEPFENRTSVSVYLEFRHLSKTTETLVLLEVMAAIIGKRMKSNLYNLELFGSFWGVYANIHGEPSLLLTVGGAAGVVTHIVDSILREILAFPDSPCPYAELKAARVHLRRKYEDYSQEKGIRRVHVAIYQLLEQGIVSPEERILALEMFDAASLQRLSQQTQQRRSYTQVLMSGDFSNDQTDKILSRCETRQWLDFPPRPLDRSICLSEGAYYQYALSDSSDINVVLFYVQVAQRTDLHSYILCKLLSQMVHSSVYHNLRDKRHLAYTISSGMKMFRNHFGLQITVPTSKHGPEHITAQVEAYMKDLQASVMQMSQNEFDVGVKTPFMQALDTETEVLNPTSLFGSIEPLQGSDNQSRDAQFSRHWCALDQIIRRAYSFGSRDCEEVVDAKEVASITVAEFQAFFADRFAPRSPTRSVMVLTSGKQSQNRKSAKHKIAPFWPKSRSTVPNTRRFTSVEQFHSHISQQI